MAAGTKSSPNMLLVVALAVLAILSLRLSSGRQNHSGQGFVTKAPLLREVREDMIREEKKAFPGHDCVTERPELRGKHLRPSARVRKVILCFWRQARVATVCR
jgi:hypothetical protein